MEQWLKFDGRIRRMGWWIAGIATSIVSGVVNEVREGDTSAIVAIVFFILAVIIWLVTLSLSVRRWHDLNKSGWWLLVNLIPIIGWIYTFVMLGFMPGDQGSNKYGAPPREGAILG